jgi:predicted TIM-barrel fold metal-dependent hydrolase
MTEPPVSTVLGVQHSPITFEMPANACDCHVHVFGPTEAYPVASSYPYRTGGTTTIEDVLALQATLGLTRVVLVQPSAYRTDNSRLVAALEQLGTRARGVAMIDPDAPQELIEELHRVGVRGCRLELGAVDIRNTPRVQFEDLARLAARIEPLGWHIETDPGLEELARYHDQIMQLPVPLVIRHCASIPAEQGTDQHGFAELQSLLRRGSVYVKLSAPQRMIRKPDAPDAQDIARALIWANPHRVLWGTDWPHNAIRKPAGRRGNELIEVFQPEDDGHALNRLRRWAVEPSLLYRILVRNPARLYRFPDPPR